MRVRYSKTADAAYIFFREPSAENYSHGKSVPLSDVLPDILVLDFDPDGRIIGLEVLGASHLLPLDLLDDAEST